jgi:hypothetical protein
MRSFIFGVMSKVDVMADDPGEGPKTIVNRFLRHKSIERMQDYLAHGRRFARLDVGQLKEDWIVAARSWLAHKDRTAERMMDDLAAELRLRKLEPPYSAIEQELADRSAQTKEVERKEALRAVAREIGEFMRENEGRSTRDRTRQIQ